MENESGASLNRAELFRLLSDCQAGDILLIEQVDRLSRLNANDWERLKTEIRNRQVKVVALDLPTSWGMASNNTDEFTMGMSETINNMMLDMIAAIARKDYEDRRRRQSQGIAKAKEQGLYKDRPENKSRNAAILKMLESGQSCNSTIQATDCFRSTLSRLKTSDN
ncbi:recombinase family protein [Brucellaceae bacterium C25G]